jgi:hypothetical protein
LRVIDVIGMSSNVLHRLILTAIRRTGKPDLKFPIGNVSLPLADFLMGGFDVFVAPNALVIFSTGFEGNGFLPGFFFTFSIFPPGVLDPNGSSDCFDFVKPLAGVGLCCRGLAPGVRKPSFLTTSIALEATTTSMPIFAVGSSFGTIT